MTTSTADKVLSALAHYELRAKSGGRYTSNSPLRPGSNSHAFSLIINGPEYGAYHDHLVGPRAPARRGQPRSAGLHPPARH